jgi:ribonuclease HI
VDFRKPSTTIYIGSEFQIAKRDNQPVYGVWFGVDDPRNIVEPFTDRIQTKNRADLKAAVAALKMVSDGVVEIRTRSEYVFQNVQYELENWKAQGWRRRRGNQNRVSNFDLWEQVHDLLERKNLKVVWSMIKPKENDGMDVLAATLLRERASAWVRGATIIQTDIAFPKKDDVGLVPSYGVWFGSGDYRNAIFPLPDEVPTPNRAELRAVILALSLVPLEPQVTISSHSTYILSNIADLQSWKQNDWKLRNGRPVWNRDLWEELAGLLESRPQQTVLWRPAITTQLMSRIMQDILSRSTVAMLGDATDRVPVSIIGA